MSNLDIENNEVTIGTDEESSNVVNVIKEHVDVTELKKRNKNIKHGLIESRNYAKYDKYLTSIKHFIKVVTRLIDAYGDIQEAYPINNEYFQKFTSTIADTTDTKVTNTKFKLPEEINKYDIVCNGYNKSIVTSLKTMFRYSKNPKVIEFISNLNLNLYPMYLPHFPKILLTPLLSKSQVTNMFSKLFANKPYLRNIYNDFINNVISIRLDRNTTNAVKFNMYDEMKGIEERYISDIVNYKPYVIDYTNNKYKYNNVSVSDLVLKKEQYLANLKKLPKDIINLINGVEPNITFIDEHCKLDPKTHMYMLDVKPFINEAEYKALPNDLKNINIMCRHEYLQYTSKNTEKLVEECFLKGKCRFCGVELNVEPEENTFDIDPIVFVVLYKYLHSVHKLNFDEGYLTNTFINTLYKVYPQIVKQKLTINTLAPIDKMTIIAICILYYTNSIDKASKTQSKLNSFIDNCDKAIAKFGFRLQDIDALCEEFNVKPYCEMFAKLVSSDSVNYNEIYSHLIFCLFKNINVLNEGFKDYKENISKCTPGQQLYLQGFKQTNRYHDEINKLITQLWNRAKEQSLLTSLTATKSKPTINVSNIVPITENDIKHYAIAAVSLCPINFYHEFEKGTCKHCQYIQNARYRTHKEFLTKYVTNYFSLFNSMNAPDVSVTGVDYTKKSAYIKSCNQFMKIYEKLDELLKDVKNKNLPNYNQYFTTNYGFDFIDPALLADQIRENDRIVNSFKTKMSLTKLIQLYFEKITTEELMKLEFKDLANIIVFMIDSHYITAKYPAKIIYESILKKPFDIRILV